ncbi:MAG: hypothetical protein HUJ67_05950 [Ruminiclostridium sp.]|nr:hypothetical protein [Ruminiclostridium sp.]
MKKLIGVLLLLCLCLCAAACSTATGTTEPTEDQTEPTAGAFGSEKEPATAKEDETPVTYDKTTPYEDQLEALLSASYQKMLVEYTALEGDIDGSFSKYLEKADAIAQWYTFCENESTAAYRAVAALNLSCYQDIISSGDAGVYKTWTDRMSDYYKYWNRGLQDYYDDWNDLYEEAYDLFDDVTELGYDELPYEQAADLWEEMYDAYSDGWENMYDLYSDGWEDLYDFHSDIWDALYDGDTNLDELFAKAFPA